MSGDRFDLELRDALREEAGHAPVVLTLGELRTRAGSQSRWTRFSRASGFAFGAAVLGIVALVLAIGLGPNRSQPSVGGSPEPSTAPASPIPSGAAVTPASARPAPTPIRTPVAIDLGAAGTVIIVRSSNDALEVIGYGSSSPETTIATVPSVSAILGDWAPEEGFRGAISPTGRVAISVVRGDIQNPEYGTALIDLTRPDQPALFADRGTFAFLSDGTFVVVPTADPSIVVRLAPPYDGSGERTRIPAGVGVVGAHWVASLSLVADGSGIYGLRDALDANGKPTGPGELVTVAWDGSARAADPTVEPLLVTGADRMTGANGETAANRGGSGATGGSGGLAVEGPTVPPVRLGFPEVGPFAWRPGGHELVFVAGDTIQSWDGTKTTEVTQLQTGQGATLTGIAGFTPTFVLFRDHRNGTQAISLLDPEGWGDSGSVAGVVG